MSGSIWDHLTRHQEKQVYIIDRATRAVISNASSTLPVRVKEDPEKVPPSFYVKDDIVIYELPDHQVMVEGETDIDVDFWSKQIPWLTYLFEENKHASQVLTDMANTLASKMYDEDILEVVIQTVIEAVPFADTGFLFLHDKQIDKLLIHAAVGFREESYRKTRLKKGEGVSGQVYATGIPEVINGEKNIRKAMTSMSDYNYTHYIKATKGREFPDCMISVPLMFENEILGVLTIDSFEAGGYFTQADLSLVKALADHAAIVLTHGRVYANEKKKREEYETTLQALRKEHEMVRRTTDFHHRLTNIAARGEGAEAIFNALKQTISYPFAVYDFLLHPYFETEGAARKELMPSFLTHPRVKNVRKTHKWNQIPLEKERLIVLPIIGVEDIWGFLCVWMPEDDIVENDIVLFEYGATVLSLELTKEEAIKEAEQGVKGELVEGLLSGKAQKTLEVQAANLGLTPGDYYSMVLTRLTPGSVAGLLPQHVKWKKEEIIRAFEEEFDKRGIKGIVAYYRSYIFAMASFDEQNGKKQARLEMKQLVDRLESWHLPLQTGVGRVHKNLNNVNHSLEDAEKCMELMTKENDPKVISFVSAGISRFLLQHSEEELNLFVDDILGPLLQYDRKKKSDFMETLISYVRYDKELKQVTEVLNVHHNTLYYRISRIQAILDIDFSDFEDWFNVQLACHVHDFLEQQ
ncbi:helix-turn-helix domain-containing protein [Salimicrobium halophilum]|uniref:GAF domain-containing protein n=1 Tax=Salimicrobium halophilum TaxID=86666 RepID=A0A1G8R1H5_9BACI|nr:GAF domain-containing protein [Salimicrobium halophilum]SDJ10826.1 GAF domain-containing protein [Salimicrobium halophilum]